jgi:DNA-binding MarR family transcriptional regulator
MKSKTNLAVVPVEEEDEVFHLDEFLPYQLSIAANRVSRLFARRFAEEYDLTIPEWRVLVVIGRYESISPSTVSEHTSMDKVKVSRAAATLVARGLVKQTQDATDGRARILRLTRKGQTVHRGLAPLARDMERQVAEGMSRSDWAALRQALGRINTHLRNLDGAEHAE